MPSPDDALQNAQILELKAATATNATAIGELNTKVGVFEARFDQQDKALERIESGTANFGTVMKDEMAAQRLADREDKDRTAKANSDWWAQAWKIAGALASAATIAAGGAGYAVYQSPAGAAAPSAIEAAP